MNTSILEIPDTYSFEEQKLIRRALKLARKKHEGQKRASSEPYIVHPIETALILMEHTAPAHVVAAGLLHDLLEDTDEDFAELRRLFGFETAKLVNAVTKNKKMVWLMRHYPGKKKQELYHYFFDLIKDPQAAMVKVADRLANMRTIEFLPEEKQIENAEETVRMYVPLADELGFVDITQELDTICHRILSEEDYRFCVDSSEQYRQEIEEQFAVHDVK